MKNIAYVLMGVVAAVMLATAVVPLVFASGNTDVNSNNYQNTGGRHSAINQQAGTSISNSGVSGGGGISPDN